MSASELFPPMPLSEWTDTKDTLHRYLQIVGKIRLDQAPRRNHWWHVPFHLTGRGLTTRPMGRDVLFAIDFDFVDHRLVINPVGGTQQSFTLEGHSVASFYRRTFEALASIGVHPEIKPVPFDLPDSTPFAEDHRAAYDPEWISRYWFVLSRVAHLLEEFAGRCYAKTSPVHHFWHTFDIAVTRFSGRPAAVDAETVLDAVSREAYSHEVISAGFWFGDDQVAEPAFYCYTAPEPSGLTEEPLEPEEARWVPSRGAHLALLTYDDARAAADPSQTVLDFYESAYQAGARRAAWDLAELRTPHAPTPRDNDDNDERTPLHMETVTTDAPDQRRYETRTDGELAAFAAYIPTDELVAFTHTEVLPGYEGKGIATALVRDALDDVRRKGRSVLAVCPFVAAYIGRHADEYGDLLYRSSTKITAD